MQMMIDSGAYYVFIWLLFAGLIYGMLEKYDVFGDSSVIGGISLGASLFILIGVYSFAPSGLFLNFSAAIGFSLFALFGSAILLSIAGVNVMDLADGIEGEILPGAAVVLILISFFGALAYNLDWTGLLGNVENTFQEVVFPIIFLIFLLIVIGETT